MWSGVVERAGEVVARWAFSAATDGGLSPLGRGELATALGIQTDCLTWPGVCHSAWIGVVDQSMDVVPQVDGLVTSLPGRALATLGADCVQLLAVDPAARVALSAHVGWRGAAQGMADSIVAALQDSGATLQSCEFWLGPSICGRCYRVDPERQAAVAAALPDSVIGQGLDIRRGLASFFADQQSNVNFIGGCTAETPTLHSFRRDGAAQRMTAAVVLL